MTDDVTWVFVIPAAAIGFAVWWLLVWVETRDEKRDVDSLTERSPYTPRCESLWCGKVLEPGVGHGRVCPECDARIHGDAS